MSATATKKSSSELLKAFIQRNKVAREKKAKLEGFSSAAEYIEFLKNNVKPAKTPVTSTSSKNTKTKKSSSKTKLTTIHVVDILDRSGSMSGLKIKNAIEFLNKGVKELQSSKLEIDYTHTYCQFNSSIELKYVSKPVKEVQKINSTPGGSTSLYDAIGSTLQELTKYLGKKDCKVLVNIYTDGGENSSTKFSASKVAELVEQYNSQNFTITFVGTPQDVDFVTNRLKVHKSNTLSYDGSGAGLEKALNKTLTSRSAYAMSALAGEDVKVGFYKDIK
jgi:hypothetical protein